LGAKRPGPGKGGRKYQWGKNLATTTEEIGGKGIKKIQRGRGEPSINARGKLSLQKKRKKSKAVNATRMAGVGHKLRDTSNRN